ncbi:MULTISPECIES: DotI/IcmL family type IV secretion protein [Pseudomonas]|uniref:Macrophage killing protein with similarity to conjugation protein n=2 Tax=Pseudomonas TaxID=286 RepID=A0A9X8QL96_9PSED|nr:MULTISPECIES: DotI/IcmL family type IV secretion protein [Pseudomonas]MCG7374319.1 DotI/IcmL family type IV secretion protein [Pseudomonas luteola]SER21532.1 Macrophage killing protein with similarity to conjugation protein [Pseudomonas lutea]SPZ04922.1 putative IcmL-like type IV secretion system protein [Pseudomonas luteola]
MRSINDDQLVGSVTFSNYILLYILAGMTVAILLLAGGVLGTLWYAKNRIEAVERTYFATTSTGSLFQLSPLDSPIGGEEKALNFSSDCVIKMMQLDYLNYRRQMNEAQLRCFTDVGYNSYLEAFTRNGIINQLNDPKIRLVMAGTPGPGEFLSKEVKVFKGVARQTYTILHPIEIVYNGNTDQPRRGKIEVDLIRINQADRPQGLAVNAIRISSK